jgi:hypothetical protein
MEQILDLMRSETWMDAAEAVRLGFADRIEGEDAAPVAAFNYGIFRRPPAHLVALAAASGWATESPAGTTETDTMSDHATAGTAPAPKAAPPAPAVTMSAADRARLMRAARDARLPQDQAEAIVATAASFEDGHRAVMAAWSGQDDREPHVPAPTATVGQSWDAGPGLIRAQADALAALLAPTLGLKHEPTMGRRHMAAGGVAETKAMMAHAWARANGERPRTDAEATRFWLSGGSATTSDYPILAANAVEAVVGRSVEQDPIGFRECVHITPATDWRTRNHVNISGSTTFAPLNESGEVRTVIVDERGEALPAPTRHAGFFRATEELIRNSARSLDLELALARAMIEGANETMRGVVAGRIATPGNLSDGVAVFHTSRGNVAAAAAAPTVTSLSVARVGMERFTDSTGTRRPVQPAIILVAPEQRTAAEQLVADITAAATPDVNPFSGRLRVVSDPGLVGTGAGGHWYVLPDPAGTDGLALIMLDDMMAPVIEAQPSWQSFGWEWRAQWPMAAAWVRPSWFRTQVPQT